MKRLLFILIGLTILTSCGKSRTPEPIPTTSVWSPASDPSGFLSFSTEDIYIGPREKTGTFTLTNVSKSTLNLEVSTDFTFVSDLTPLQRQSFQKRGWQYTVDPGVSVVITVAIEHPGSGKEGIEKGIIKIKAFDSQNPTKNWTETSVKVAVETSSRDHFANVVGKVTDTEGNPLKDVLLYCNCTRTSTLSDENGNYSFEDLPFVTSVNITAFSENHLRKRSESVDYRIDELVFNLVLEPCPNHLTFDRREVDFGSGSISQSEGQDPEEIRITFSADKDVSDIFDITTQYLEGPIPGLEILPVSGGLINDKTIRFILHRSESKEGTYHMNVLLTTNESGCYLIPVSFINTP